MYWCKVSTLDLSLICFVNAEDCCIVMFVILRQILLLCVVLCLLTLNYILVCV